MKPARTAPDTGLIRIEPATKPAAKDATKPGSSPAAKAAVAGSAGTAHDPAVFWDKYYRTHDDKPESWLETVSYLGRVGKFDHVEAATMAYLRYHPKNAVPLMYETLATALDLNKRGPEKVKTALGYAAYLALRSKQTDQLTMVADLLYMRGYFEPFDVKVGAATEQVSVGRLLDLAAEIAPHLPIAHMMSINLALKTKDPKRMADSIERLLSLGWPGMDDTVRQQARRAAETMAKTLREDDRSAEADPLLAHLTESEGRDLYIRLTWKGDADLDLNVGEPLGAVTSHQLRRTVFGGAIIKEGLGSLHAEEIYVCPRAFDGDYSVRVATIYNDEKQPVTEAKLEVITREGLSGEQKETHTVLLPSAKPVVVHVTGGRRKVVLPFVAAAAQPIQATQPSAAPAAKPAAPAQPSAARAADALQVPGSRPGARPSNTGTPVIGTGSGRPKPPPIVVSPDQTNALPKRP